MVSRFKPYKLCTCQKQYKFKPYKLCICHANKRTITNSGLPSHKTYGIRTFENKEWPTATQKSFGHPSTVHKTRLNYSMAGSICALHPCTPQLTQHTSRAKVGVVEQRPHVLFEAPRCISAPKSTEVCDLQQHSEALCGMGRHRGHSEGRGKGGKPVLSTGASLGPSS